MVMRCTAKTLADALRVVCIAIWCGNSSSTQALVSAASQTNTNAPADGSPWANVGGVNGASGIYLGGGWVLTAAHVGPGDFGLSGAQFAYDGISHRLTNSDGTATDMIMFHLSTLPGLPPLMLASNNPSALAPIDMVAYGYIAGSSQTNIGSYTGFYWSGAGFKSWGNNKVKATGLTVNGGFGNLSAFSTDFSNPTTSGSASNEAQAAAGDSGGAVFQQNGSTWQLVGMIDAIGPMSGQPTDAAVYGELTYLANIATYRGQVQAWIASTVPKLSVSLAGAQVQVCWADTGVPYSLQTAADPLLSHWSTVKISTSSANGQLYTLLPATNPFCLFRLLRN